MRAYFTPERQIDLDRIARSWLGTPFFPHGRIKGRDGGVSCETLAFLIYAEAGFLSSTMEVPKGSLKCWYVHRKSLIVPFIETWLANQFDPLTPAWRLAWPGDLLRFTDDNCEHLGILLPDNQVIHCLRPWGVLISPIADATYHERIANLWRPVETTNPSRL